MLDPLRQASVELQILEVTSNLMSENVTYLCICEPNLCVVFYLKIL